MEDYLLRIMAKDAGLLALVCSTTQLADEARQRHAAYPAATAALGQGLTAAALLGALLKVGQRVAFKVQGNGPLGQLIAEADNFGRVRGYVIHPQATVPDGDDPMDLNASLGPVGLMTVVQDLKLKDLYEGVIQRQGGRLDADLVYYLTHSEQVPSLVEIGVQLAPQGTVRAAGGWLVQTLPGQAPSALLELAERMEDLPDLEQLLTDGYTPEQVAAALFGPVPYDVLEKHPLRFTCSCSREQSAQALLLLGRADLEELLQEGEGVVDCHFCGERYTFDRQALRELLTQT